MRVCSGGVLGCSGSLTIQLIWLGAIVGPYRGAQSGAGRNWTVGHDNGGREGDCWAAALPPNSYKGGRDGHAAVHMGGAALGQRDKGPGPELDWPQAPAPMPRVGHFLAPSSVRSFGPGHCGSGPPPPSRAYQEEPGWRLQAVEREPA